MPRKLQAIRISGAGPVTIEARPGEGRKLRRFDMLAYTGAGMHVDGYDRPVYVDLAGVQVPSKHRPVLRGHNHDLVVGHTDTIEVSDSIRVSGVISGVGPHVDEVMALSDNGFPWQASIGADPEEIERVDQGMQAVVNGREITGPAYIARRTTLGEISFVPLGADGATAAAVLAKKRVMGGAMDFETWLLSLGFDKPDSLTEVQRANLQIKFEQETGSSSGEEATAAAEDEEMPTPPAAEAAEDGEEEEVPMAAGRKLRLLAQQRRQQADEEIRIGAVRQICATAGNPTITVRNRVLPLSAHAIAEGWTAERTELEVLRSQREKAGPFIASHGKEKDCTLQALQGAMLLRCGGRLDHPSYTGYRAVAMRLPGWLRAGINTDVRQRAMEAAHHYADMSLVDLCREAIRLDGKDAPHGRQQVIRAAFSGSSLDDIFTTNVNALLLATYEEAPDTTQGWVRETEAADFRTMDKIRMVKGGTLTQHPPGKEADHESRSDTKESYKIARYSKQFVIDEQDIINDMLGALSDIPVEMGNAAARLRPDLVYSILKANAALNADSVALFHTSHSNTDTSAALAAATLKTGITKVMLQTENSVNLNLTPTHLIVPTTLAFTADELVNSATIVIAGTAGSVTERGVKNTLSGRGLTVVADARLDNGVTDPSSGTAYSGDTNDWFLAVASAYGIEVAYLRGTGRSPQTRSWVLEQGKYGLGYDICHDIGAKALDYRGLYRGVG